MDSGETGLVVQDVNIFHYAYLYNSLEWNELQTIILFTFYSFHKINLLHYACFLKLSMYFFSLNSRFWSSTSIVAKHIAQAVFWVYKIRSKKPWTPTKQRLCSLISLGKVKVCTSNYYDRRQYKVPIAY